ncbi:unnamed protein product, partial [Coregonus sp. 'balchen']
MVSYCSVISQTEMVKLKEVDPPQVKPKEVEPAQVKLKERQKLFEEAFQQDMDQYLSTGYLQITERRGPIGSFSSMEVNVDMLEQMDLMDISDHDSLDSLTTEITLQVPTQAELRNKLSSLSSTCTDSQDTEAGEDDEEDEGGREGSSHCPVGVQSYEAEVPPNTVLAERPPTPPRSKTLKHFEDSSSQAT